MGIKNGIGIGNLKELDMFIIGIEFNNITQFKERLIFLSICVGWWEIIIGRFIEQEVK